MITRDVQRPGVVAIGGHDERGQKKESGIVSPGGHSIFSTQPGSGSCDGRSVDSNCTSHTSATATSRELSASATKPSFAQRWPRLSQVLRVAVAVVAFPLLVAVNTVAIPLVHLAALCSRGLGDGSLAESLGKSGWVRTLWGEDFAHRLATDDLPVLLMVASFVFPGLIPLQSLWFSSQRALELAEGRTVASAKREDDAPEWTRFAKLVKDQGLDPRNYRWDKEWKTRW